MNARQGVACTSCGASTPLPDDLRTPTFQCAFCKATLSTAHYAGVSAVSADALHAHMRQHIAQPPADVIAAIRSAPKFEGQSTETRAMPCKRCGGSVGVPLDLTVRQLTCGGCGATQWVNEYISDGERFAMDMQRQVAGNDALEALKANGVPCTKCGGINPFPPDGQIQTVCKFCGAVVLLSEHVDATAVARARLKENVFGLRDELMREQQRRDRLTSIVIGVVVIGGLAIAGIAALLMR